MTHINPQKLGFLPKLVLASSISLIIAGMLWHGVTLEAFERTWRNLAGRPSGPMSFRFIVQPSMAAVAAIYDGIKDGRTGRSPYLWTVVHKPQERIARLREGLNATARIMLLGLAMDVIYQLIEFERFYPVEAPIIAFLLAFVPYVLVRGLAARIARQWRGGGSAGELR